MECYDCLFLPSCDLLYFLELISDSFWKFNFLHPYSHFPPCSNWLIKCLTVILLKCSDYLWVASLSPPTPFIYFFIWLYFFNWSPLLLSSPTSCSKLDYLYLFSENSLIVLVFYIPFSGFCITLFWSNLKFHRVLGAWKRIKLLRACIFEIALACLRSCLVFWLGMKFWNKNNLVQNSEGNVPMSSSFQWWYWKSDVSQTSDPLKITSSISPKKF